MPTKNIHLSSAAALASALLTIAACDPDRAVECLPQTEYSDGMHEHEEDLEGEHDPGTEATDQHWPNPWTWLGSCNTAQSCASDCAWPWDLGEAFEACALDHGPASPKCSEATAALVGASAAFQVCWDACGDGPEPWRSWTLIGLNSGSACATFEAYSEHMSEAEAASWAEGCSSGCDPATWSAAAALVRAHLLDPDYCAEHPGGVYDGCDL